MNVIDTRDRNDRADCRALYLDLLQTVVLVELADLDLADLIGIMVIDDDRLLADADGAVVDLAAAYASHILIVIDRGNEHLGSAVGIALGRGNMLNYRIKQGLHVLGLIGKLEDRDSRLCRRVNERRVELVFARVELNEEVEYLVNDSLGIGLGTVDLVDADDDRQAQLQGLLQNELGLGHRALKCVNDEDYAVNHLEHSLNLAAEIGVAGRVYDIYLYSVVIDRRILRKDRDSSFSLKIVRVHDSFLNDLILAENTALLQ